MRGFLNIILLIVAIIGFLFGVKIMLSLDNKPIITAQPNCFNICKDAESITLYPECNCFKKILSK